jgi:hypothetical protein
VTWPAAFDVWPLKQTSRVRGFTPLAWNANGVVMARARLGRGTVLAVAIDPFQNGQQGHELFPTLGVEAARTLGTPPGPRRYAAELYFDPGTMSLTPEQVAARFADARAIYVAGWNYGFLDRSFDYPYARLIDALHARGVRVYAWLEPPEVNLALWTQHPECRERTRAGKDAVVDWRSLIALEDPSCFDLAWSVWRGLLQDYDWDGVNVAELYFEAGNIDPNRMTPFHPSALAAFGHDPLADMQGFLDWRTREVTQLNRQLVSRIRALEPNLDIELTVIDDELDPDLGRNVGSDVKSLAAVARDYGASLQVEDPFTTWTQGPNRYAQLVPKVTPLMPPQRAFFDINVVPRYNGRPTAQMTGVELSLSAMKAAQASGRVAIYSTATLTDSNLAGLPFALAGAASTGDSTVSAPWSVVVVSPRRGYGRLLLDGRRWPAAAGRAIIPAGSHTVQWLRGTDGFAALERLQGELKDESSTASSLRVVYSADATAWSGVNRRPTSLAVDGAPSALVAVPNPAGGYTVRLPRGTHDVKLSF